MTLMTGVGAAVFPFAGAALGAGAVFAASGAPFAGAGCLPLGAAAGVEWPLLPLAFAIGFTGSAAMGALALLAAGVAFVSGFLGSRVFPVANFVVFGETDFGEVLGIPDKEGTVPALV